VTACTAQTCPAGKHATKANAGSVDEGCTICDAGKYSLGGAATVCLDMNCPHGQLSVKQGSTTAVDGCGECDKGF